jgi:hypothetical protein
VFAVVMIAALPVSCGSSFDNPGEQNYRTVATVINRTEREVQVFSQGGTINVAACGEVDFPNFPINSWNITSPGSDMIRSVGGHSEPHSYLIVTQVVRQVDSRPDPLPVCSGVLQPAH